MHLKITVEIDGRQAGTVESDLRGSAEEVEEQVREVVGRTGRIVLETAFQAGEQAGSAPRCGCGCRLENWGYRPLTLTSTFGLLKLSRRRYRCPCCGTEVYPMDLEWRCGGHRMTRPLAKRICQLATITHFPQMPGLLRDQHGVQLQHEAILQLAHDVGGVAESQRRMTAETRVLRDPAGGQQVPPEVRPQRVLVSCDGILYCTNQTGEIPGQPGSKRLLWQQMKVGCVCWRDERGQWRKQLVWGRESPEEFGASLFELACRHGYLQAREKLFAADGGGWCWDIQARYFQDARGILDWYHTSEHVWTAARRIGREEVAVKAWAEAALDQLRTGGGEGLVAWLKPQIATRRGPPRQALEELRHYVAGHVKSMHYADYREAGWPIGTGMMESSCKQLVGQRLKGPGMHWTEAGALAITALRTLDLNQKWHEFWKSLILTV